MIKEQKKGIIKQIIGAVIDVQFEGNAPDIYTALEVDQEKQG